MNHNKPDIVIKIPGERKSQLTDIAITQYQNNVSKENEKGNKYIDLKYKIKTEIISFCNRSLSSVSKRLKTYIDAIGISDIIGSAKSFHSS